jgi:hypothetical protein
MMGGDDGPLSPPRRRSSDEFLVRIPHPSPAIPPATPAVRQSGKGYNYAVEGARAMEHRPADAGGGRRRVAVVVGAFFRRILEFFPHRWILESLCGGGGV